MTDRNGMRNLADLNIDAFSDGEKRKKALFFWIGIFLILDGVMFLGLLICAYISVAKGSDWHVFLAPALAGAVGAIIASMTVRAVWGMKPDKTPSASIPSLVDMGKNLAE